MPQSIGELFLAEQQAAAEAAEAAPAPEPEAKPAEPEKETPPAETQAPEKEDHATSEEAEPGSVSPEKEVPAPETPAPPRTFKVTIDGEEMEVDEPELKKGYQLAKVSHQRIQDATERTKAINWTMEQMVMKPAETFVQLAGRKMRGGEEEARRHWDQLCVNRVREMIQEESLTEEQRQILADRRELERQQRAITAHQERQKQEIQARLDQQADERLQADFQAALKKHGLPDIRILRQLTADKLLQAMDSGIEMTADEAVYESAKEWKALINEKPQAPKPAAPQKQASEFPSTPSGEGAPPPKAGTQRQRPAKFDTVRKFHEHIANSI